jgi:hypothetical protein
MQTLTFAKDSTWQIMVTPDGHYGKLVVDELCVLSPKSLSILQTETNPKIGQAAKALKRKAQPQKQEKHARRKLLTLKTLRHGDAYKEILYVRVDRVKSINIVMAHL